MSLRTFLIFTEARTKVVSLYAFALGSLMALLRFQKFDVPRALLLFLAFFSLDLAATAINHFREAPQEFGRLLLPGTTISRNKAQTIIALLLAIGLVAGAALGLEMGLVLWIFGAISVGAALSYSLGPVPLMATPLGEVVSATVMGFILPFVSLYIHGHKGLINHYLFRNSLTIQLDLIHCFAIFLPSFTLAVAIANVMLANNRRDEKKDTDAQRHTLVSYLGQAGARQLSQGLVLLGIFTMAFALVLGLYPKTGFLVILGQAYILYNHRRFAKITNGSRIFRLALFHLNITGLTLILSLSLSLLFHW